MIFVVFLSLSVAKKLDGKAVPCHPLRAYRGSRGIALIFLNLVARWAD